VNLCEDADNVVASTASVVVLVVLSMYHVHVTCVPVSYVAKN